MELPLLLPIEKMLTRINDSKPNLESNWIGRNELLLFGQIPFGVILDLFSVRSFAIDNTLGSDNHKLIELEINNIGLYPHSDKRLDRLHNDSRLC